MSKEHKSFLVFELWLRPKDKKTDVWTVRNAINNVVLGQIRWRGAWRCYTFEPMANTVYNNACMLEIVEHIRQAMLARNENADAL